MTFSRRIRSPFTAAFPLTLLAGCFLSLLGLSSAQAQEGKVVKEIDVQYVGNQTVSPQRIKSNMSTKVGDTLSMAALDEDLKSLYASGDVERARFLADNVSGGVKLIVVVQSRAVYGGVQFNGNTLIDDSKLGRKVDLAVNKPIDESALQTAREDIQEMYRKKGFNEATITYQISAPTSEGYSMVVFNIDEGTQGVLRNIEFVGNDSFPAARLKEEMEQKEKGVKSLFGSGGSTDAETLALDVRAIEDFYRDNGFLNARVVNVSRMRVDAKYVDVVMTIDEGQTYQVDSLAINGVTALSMENDVFPFLKTKAGDKFAGNKLKDDIKLISDQYGSRGYVDARVNPRLEEAPGGVRVVLDVEEGRPYTIGEVHIEGNDKTFDRVIRRELPLEPGQPFDTTKTEVTKRRLENMNYFSSVDIIPLDTSYIDEKDLLIRVVEKPTGTVNFGAGFSSIDSVTGFFEVTQSNFDLFGWGNDFTGAGQRFRLSLRGGNERKDFSISVTEPWLFGIPLALTTEAYYRDLLFLSDQYDQQEVGAAVSLRKALGEFTYGVLEYRGEQIEIDAEPTTSPAFLAEDGDFFKSSVAVNIVRDTRDNIFLPREGHKLSAGFEFVGLGGDVDDTVFTATAAQFFDLPYDAILSFNGRFQHSSDGDQIFMRHFLGGANTLRGYEYRDVGPRDPVTGDVLGGNTAWYGTAEISVPVVEKIRIAAFYDIGEVSDGPAGTIGGGLHDDYGLGLRLFVLGNAPVRLDYALPGQNDGFSDDGGRFQFTMGAQF